MECVLRSGRTLRAGLTGKGATASERSESAVPDGRKIIRSKYGAPWTKEGATASERSESAVRDGRTITRRKLGAQWTKGGCHGQRAEGSRPCRMEGQSSDRSMTPGTSDEVVDASGCHGQRAAGSRPCEMQARSPDESRTPGARPHCRLAALAGSGTLRPFAPSSLRPFAPSPLRRSVAPSLRRFPSITSPLPNSPTESKDQTHQQLHSHSDPPDTRSYSGRGPIGRGGSGGRRRRPFRRR